MTERDQYESLLELQKVTEECEIASKKLDEAKSLLQKIQKQCIESKNELEKLNHDMKTFTLKELTLSRIVSSKTEKETQLQAECEKTYKKLDAVLWRRQILKAKLELENYNRKRYENKMNTPIEPPSFLKADEHESSLQEIHDLKNKLNVLQKEVLEKQKLNAEYEKSLLEAQKSNNKHLENVQELRKNIDNIEILIDQQEELRKISSNEAE